MKKPIITLTLLLTLLASTSFAQKLYMRFGKIENEEVKTNVYPADSTAGAVVLGDYGDTSFEYSGEKGWSIIFKRHRRVKILNKNGYDHADFAIHYYEPESGTAENIIGLRGVTYNNDGGKIVKTKLSKDGIFNERINKYWKQRKFTMPEVREGSVIEYEYTIKSEYVRYLRDWEFQSDIPVVWSEYRVLIPEFFIYKTLMQGYHPLAIHEKDRKQEEFSWRRGGSTSSTTALAGQEGTIPSLSQKSRFVAKNVPAFRKEPFMTASQNYISKVNFELSTIQFKGRLPKNMLGTWDAMNQSFLEHSSFGQQVKGSGFLNKVVPGLVEGVQEPTEKMQAIYNHVKSRMAWDGFQGKWLSSTLKKVYEAKKGNVSDINLLLTSMLQKAGLAADPVLLSTRANGFVQTTYPNTDQFNYVLCRVIIGDNYYLLDATNPYLPISLIPEKCLNGKGWAVSESSSGWVNLVSGQKRSEKTSATLQLTSDGNMEGTVKRIYSGYDASSKRKRLLSEGKDSYLDKIKTDYSWEVSDLSIEEERNLNKPLVEKLEVNIPPESDGLGSVTYFNPMLLLRESENPFKSTDRKFPVDLASAREKTFYLVLTLPEGYVVEELPERTSFVLPNNGAKFTYSANVRGNTLTVLSKLSFNKPLFVQTEYQALRQFYGLVVAKHAEQVVLKKT